MMLLTETSTFPVPVHTKVLQLDDDRAGGGFFPACEAWLLERDQGMLVHGLRDRTVPPRCYVQPQLRAELHLAHGSRGGVKRVSGAGHRAGGRADDLVRETRNGALLMKMRALGTTTVDRFTTVLAVD